MLEKNGKPIENLRSIPKIAEYLEYFENSKKVAIFELVPKYFKYDTLNKRKLNPRSFHIENFFDILEDSQTVRYLYYENKTRMGDDDFRYSPNFISFNDKGVIVVPKEKPELFVFLMLHTRRAQSKNADPTRMAHFYLVDSKLEAKEKAEKKKQLAQVNHMVWNDGIDEDVLKTIAKTYQIRNVDDMSLDEVRGHLDKLVTKNPSIFIEKQAMGKDVETRALVQTAVDLGVLVFKKSKTSAQWFFRSDAGTDSHLCHVRGGETPMDRITTWLLEHDEGDNIGRLEEVIVDKKRVEKMDALVESDPISDGSIADSVKKSAAPQKTTKKKSPADTNPLKQETKAPVKEPNVLVGNQDPKPPSGPKKEKSKPRPKPQEKEVVEG